MKTFRPRGALAAAVMLSVLTALAGCGASASSSSSTGMSLGGMQANPASSAAEMNPNLDLGSSLGLPAGPGHQAGEPVRPADVAQPVPRQGRHAGLRGFRVHDGLPADHAEHAAGQAAARRRGRPGATARRRREPDRHQRRGRAGLLPCARHGQPVGLPDRLAGPAEGRVERLPHRRADREGPDRPHPRAVRHRPAGPGAEALPDPDGLLQRRPVRAGARRRAVQPAARPPARGQPGVAGVHHRAGPLGSRRPVRRPRQAPRSCWAPGRRAW